MAKKKHEEHENHERWLVSYADFITLLFAFFVVMYSVSSVNEGKYRTVSESIKAALNPIVSPPSSTLAFTLGTNKPATIQPSLAGAKEPVVRKLRAIMKSVNEAAQFEIIQVVERSSGEIVITIPDHVMFNSGEATLRPAALPFLKALAEVLTELDRQVRIEGHTDNVPIRTAQYPSNWELSAARAVIVVRVMSELYGVPAQHLSATGRADSLPRTDNLTPEHRAKNRRVEIVVLAEHKTGAEPGEATGHVEGEVSPTGLTPGGPEPAPAIPLERSDSPVRPQ